MRIHCVCIVRDEADVLGYTLDSALRWAHAIYVCDNNSSDGTWELLQEYASRHPQLVLVDRDTGVFREALRGETTNKVTSEARPGDWWCRLDADEIYFDDPRDFLARVAPRHAVVYCASMQYYFTDVDLAAYERDPSLYTEQWKPERMRYFLTNWSEPRFVRHVPGVEWIEAWPAGWEKMRATPKRIRLRHYQYRSPPQIERRIRTRMANTEWGAFWHEKAERWLPKYGIREQDRVFPNVSATDGELWRTRVIHAAALQQEGDEVKIDEKLLPRVGHRSVAQGVLNRLRRPLSR